MLSSDRPNSQPAWPGGRVTVAARTFAGDRWHLVDHARLVDDAWHPSRCGETGQPAAWVDARRVPVGQRCQACGQWPQGVAW